MSSNVTKYLNYFHACVLHFLEFPGNSGCVNHIGICPNELGSSLSPEIKSLDRTSCLPSGGPFPKGGDSVTSFISSPSQNKILLPPWGWGGGVKRNRNGDY